MAIQIETQRDILRHTARRSVTAAGLAGVMIMSMLLLHFGTDLDARISVRQVITFVPPAGLFIAVTVCALLTYRSGLLMMELTHARRELARVSQTDQLTGLLNRRGFDEAAEAALYAARQSGIPAAIFMCDLDHFKAINDRFGHEIGDMVLAGVADVLRQFAERHDALAGRYGGEEFAIILPNTSKGGALRLAERLRQSAEASAPQKNDGKDPIPGFTISIGVATYPDDATSMEELLLQADNAELTAKRLGKNQVYAASSANKIRRP